MPTAFDAVLVYGKDRKTFAKVFNIGLTIVLATNAVRLLALLGVVGNLPNIFVKRF